MGVVGEWALTELPTALADYLDENWGVFLAAVYFVPECTAAQVGGMTAAWLISEAPTPARTVKREDSAALAG